MMEKAVNGLTVGRLDQRDNNSDNQRVIDVNSRLQIKSWIHKLSIKLSRAVKRIVCNSKLKDIIPEPTLMTILGIIELIVTSAIATIVILTLLLSILAYIQAKPDNNIEENIEVNTTYAKTNMKTNIMIKSSINTEINAEANARGNTDINANTNTGIKYMMVSPIYNFMIVSHFINALKSLSLEPLTFGLIITIIVIIVAYSKLDKKLNEISYELRLHNRLMEQFKERYMKTEREVEEIKKIVYKKI